MEAPAPAKGATLVSVDGRSYPLQSARIEAEATGGIARSALVQTYRNPYAEALEVVYTLPLPADGAVVGYTMRLGERVIRGEVRPRAQARRDYEKALFEGRHAALLEQERDDTFTQRLGSLPAGVEAEITIEVLHPLGFLVGSAEKAAEWEYRFPTVVSVRYEGGSGRVPDADKLDVDRGGAGAIPTRIELKLDVIDDAGSVEHRVESMPLDRDLVVRWAAGRAEVGARLVEGPGLAGDDGRYALLTITPPAVAQRALARDVTILIDASGSMEGPPLEWAKEVTKGLLGSLTAADRFEVIAFDVRPRSLTKGLVDASEKSLGAALKEIARLGASGGTEMVDAVIEALRPLRPESQHQVVLITDGQIGFEDDVVRRVREGLPDGARLHTVAVGSAPNRTLTARAARAGRGAEMFVCGEADVAGAVQRAVAATARPVLTDLRIESAAVKGIVPARPRDVMAAQPVVLALELSAEGGVIEVTGTLAGSSSPWTWRMEVPPAVADRPLITVPVGALYARELIIDLEVSGSGSDELVEQVAMRHRIASRVTSLVAIADEPAIDPRQPKRRVVLPVEVPAFQSAEGLGLLGTYRAMAGRFRVTDTLYLGERGDEEPLLLGDAMYRGQPAAPEARAAKTHPFRPSALARFRSMLFGATGRLVRGRVVALEGDLIVIEYETPGDRFFAPSAETVVVRAGRAPVDTAVIDPALSSPGGWHGNGLVLRLALRRAAGWTIGEELTLEWGGEARWTILVGEPA
jgi:Ca-activated chloride channel family protein